MMRGPTRWNWTTRLAAAAAAIETDVVRAQAGREAGVEQELGIKSRDLEEHAAGTLIPVQREVTIEFLEAGGAIFDRLRRSRTLLLRGLPGIERRTRKQQRTDQ